MQNKENKINMQNKETTPYVADMHRVGDNFMSTSTVPQIEYDKGVNSDYISLTKAIELFEEYKMDHLDDCYTIVPIKQEGGSIARMSYYNMPLWCNLLICIGNFYATEENKLQRNNRVISLPALGLYETIKTDFVTEYKPLPQYVVESLFPADKYYYTHSYYDKNGKYSFHNGYDYNSCYEPNRNYDEIRDNMTHQVICSEVCIKYSELREYVKALRMAGTMNDKVGEEENAT